MMCVRRQVLVARMGLPQMNNNVPVSLRNNQISLVDLAKLLSKASEMVATGSGPPVPVVKVRVGKRVRKPK